MPGALAEPRYRNRERLMRDFTLSRFSDLNQENQHDESSGQAGR